MKLSRGAERAGLSMERSKLEWLAGEFGVRTAHAGEVGEGYAAKWMRGAKRRQAWRRAREREGPEMLLVGG